MKYTRKEFYKFVKKDGWDFDVIEADADGLWIWIERYSKKMQRLQNKACAKSYINSFDKNETVSSVAHHNIKNTPLVIEKINEFKKRNK